MAGDVMKGLVAKIGADTSDFVKELKKVDKEINATQKTATELQKSLELKFDENRFIQAQRKIKAALSETEEKAKAIKAQLKYLEETGGVNTEGYERLQTELAKSDAEALKLQKQLKELNKIKVDSATKSIQELSTSLETAAKKTAILSGAAAGAIAGIVKLGKDAIKTGDEIQTTADKYNLSAEAIQRWNYIALQTDVANETLYKSMTKVRDAMGTAMVGETNAATEAMQKLGISFEQIDDDEQAFENVVEALSRVQDSTLQAYYANEIFGERIATDLIPLLKQGSDAIDKYSKEFEEVGYLSNEQVAKLSELDNELNKLNTQFQNIKTELGLALTPILQMLANILEKKIIPAIKSLADWFNSLDDKTKEIIVTALLLVASLSPMLLIGAKLIKGIGTLINLFNILSVHPIIAIIGVVIGLLTYLYASNERFRESVNKLLSVLGKALGTIIEPIVSMLSSIFDLITPIADLLANILAPALDMIAVFLEPIVWLLEKIDELWNKVKDGILTIFGKGWLWGTNDDSSSESSSYTRPNLNDYSFDIPKVSSSNYSNNYSNDTYNLDLTLNATGNLDYDARSLADEVIKQIAIKKQASGR